MASAAPLTLAYTSQPAGSRVILVEADDVLTLTVPARGTWAEFRGLLLPFLLWMVFSCGPPLYFNWHFRRTFNLPLPLPWAAFGGTLVFGVIFNLALAWFSGGIRRTIVLAPDTLVLEVQGRFRKRTRTFARDAVASVRMRSWCQWLELRNASGRAVCRLEVYGRAERKWVADTLRSKLGLLD